MRLKYVLWAYLLGILLVITSVVVKAGPCEDCDELKLQEAKAAGALAGRAAAKAYLDSIGGSVPPPDTTTVPPPPPGSGDCLEGYQALSAWWDGWCGDESRNFTTEGSLGVMKSNAEAYKITSLTPQAVGRASIEVLFRTAQIPQDAGGGHLFTAASSHKSVGRNWQQGWLRPDIEPSHSRWYIHTYNLDGNGNRWFLRNGNLDAVVDVWDTGIPIAGVNQWIRLTLDWERRATDKLWLRLTVGGVSRERIITIHPASVNPGCAGVGNMDGLTNFGGMPQIAYRNFSWN
jgi:hypothetical protein